MKIILILSLILIGLGLSILQYELYLSSTRACCGPGGTLVPVADPHPIRSYAIIILAVLAYVASLLVFLSAFIKKSKK